MHPSRSSAWPTARTGTAASNQSPRLSRRARSVSRPRPGSACPPPLLKRCRAGAEGPWSTASTIPCAVAPRWVSKPAPDANLPTGLRQTVPAARRRETVAKGRAAGLRLAACLIARCRFFASSRRPPRRPTLAASAAAAPSALDQGAESAPPRLRPPQRTERIEAELVPSERLGRARLDRYRRAVEDPASAGTPIGATRGIPAVRPPRLRPCLPGPARSPGPCPSASGGCRAR